MLSARSMGEPPSGAHAPKSTRHPQSDRGPVYVASWPRGATGTVTPLRRFRSPAGPRSIDASRP